MDNSDKLTEDSRVVLVLDANTAAVQGFVACRLALVEQRIRYEDDHLLCKSADEQIRADILQLDRYVEELIGPLGTSR